MRICPWPLSEKNFIGGVFRGKRSRKDNENWNPGW